MGTETKGLVRLLKEVKLAVRVRSTCRLRLGAADRYFSCIAPDRIGVGADTCSIARRFIKDCVTGR